MNVLPPPRRAVALALMVVAPVLWSLAGVLTRQIQSASAFEMAFWRSSIAAAFVFLALLFLQDRRPWDTLRAAGLAGLVSGAMWAVMFTCFIVALTLTTVANVLVVSSLGPLCTALLAWLMLREPIPARSWLAIVAASVGMGAMFGAGFTAAYYARGADSYAYRSAADSVDLAARVGMPIPAAVLDVQTATRSARVGIAASYVGPRFESGLSVERTVSASQGRVPAGWTFQLVLRASRKVF